MIREIREELGLNCQFKDLLAIRELENFRFGLPEIYFLGHLLAPTKNFIMDTYELIDAAWFNQVNYSKNKYIFTIIIELIKRINRLKNVEHLNTEICIIDYILKINIRIIEKYNK